MILLANTMLGIAMVLDSLLFIVMILVIIRAVISWFSPDPRNPLVRVLSATTDPLLFPIQKRIPAFGGLDLSPIILLFAVMFLRFFLVQSLRDYAVLIRASVLGG